jgi:hypothetical protein
VIGGSADAVKKLGWLDVECSSKPNDRGKPGISYSSLQATDLGWMQTTAVTQRFLREISAFAQSEQVGRKLLSRFHEPTCSAE